MAGDWVRRLAQLQQAYENGHLDEDTYRAAVSALVAHSPPADTTDDELKATSSAAAIAAAARGVAIGGNADTLAVITGDGNTYIVGNTYMGPPMTDPAIALNIYRRLFVAGCRQLPLRAIDVNAADAQGNRKEMDLDQLYVALDTTQTLFTADEADETDKGDSATEPDQFRVLIERERPKPLSLLGAAIRQPRLVILGAPGCGKSTFLNHLGLCLALYGLELEGEWLTRLPEWPTDDADLAPIGVIMRDFARSFPHIPKRATPDLLWNFIVEGLTAQNLAFAVQPLHEQLEAGHVLVLLDGMDEIPTGTQRTFVRDVVAAFGVRYPNCRMIVTCRTLSYQDADWQLLSFYDVEVAELDTVKINRFITAWYSELSRLGAIRRADAAGLASRLQDAVQRPDLRRLAPNPLLLTVMALVHTHRGRLPDARALLYEDTVDLLLLRWEESKRGDTDSITDGKAAPPADGFGLRHLLAQTGRNELDLKRVLWQLAFDAHAQAGGAQAGQREWNAGDQTEEAPPADIGELQLEKALAGLHPEKSRDWAGQLIEAMKIRAGLLLERAPESYSFRHRTFQEYLAGAHLASLADFAQQAAALGADGAYWREVILLAVGRLVYLSGDLAKPLALVDELYPRHMPRSQVAWQPVWLAGAVLEEIGPKRATDSKQGQDLLARTQQRLAALVDKGALTPIERAAAGATLGRLGDPRRGVGVKNGLPDIEWATVEAGPFLMGSDKSQDRYAQDNELPQFACDLIQQPYQISRYPITVAQYGAFVQAGGYNEAAYWPEAAAQGLWRDGQIRCRTWSVERSGYEEAWATGPADYGSRFTIDNHPQVGVSWYEALAFCSWLSAKTGIEVRLPTEAEWERAARHTDGRIYPWGKQGNVAERCNMVDTGINSTSAVGAFPTGAAMCGAADMVGNVVQWCSTQWRENYQDYAAQVDDGLAGETRRVVRGGAFGDLQLSERARPVASGTFPSTATTLSVFGLCVPPAVDL